MFNTICITSVTATITALLGVAPPADAAPAIRQVTEKAAALFDGRQADRVLMYNPDAVALWLFQKYTDLYSGVLDNTQLGLPMLSVMPCVTPVCFASMYTGVQPAVHGIETYVKPVLKIDTVFDALLKAGKKVALVSTTDDSVSMIFLERAMDYYIYDTPEECNLKAMELIEQDHYDLIVVYNGNYDENMHHHSPEGEESLAALRDNMAAFYSLTKKTKAAWKAHDTVVVFAPDHGCHHIDGGMGDHGLNMPEDMNILHFYGFQPKE